MGLGLGSRAKGKEEQSITTPPPSKPTIIPTQHTPRGSVFPQHRRHRLPRFAINQGNRACTLSLTMLRSIVVLFCAVLGARAWTQADRDESLKVVDSYGFPRLEAWNRMTPKMLQTVLKTFCG